MPSGVVMRNGGLGTGTIIPAGFAGAGRMILGEYYWGYFYTAPYTANQDGTYTIGNVTQECSSGDGPEGIVYVNPANPFFSTPSILVSFENKESNHLGMPLPAGKLRVYKEDPADGTLEFVGEDVIDHTPRNETVKVRIGEAFDVVGDRTRTDFKVDTAAKRMTETIRVEVRNQKKAAQHVRLVEHMNRDTTVLIPGFPTRELERIMRGLGFHNIVRTENGAELSLGPSLRVAIHTETSITDGPGGDSAIVISDGTGRLVNQNDCRTNDLDALRGHGPVDLHWLQYSGAIWYPMVYQETPERMRELIDAKVDSQFSRAMRYVESIGARAVVPSAGPPAFLDPELFQFNVIDGDELSIFPDQQIGRAHV